MNFGELIECVFITILSAPLENNSSTSFLVFIPHIIINYATDLSILKDAYLISVIGVELFFCLSGYLICKQGIYIVISKQRQIKNTCIFN